MTSTGGGEISTHRSPMFPSEYFFRQFYATFFNDPPARWIFDAWGRNNLMWSNDYPHPNSTWPKSWDVITRDLGNLSEETRSRLLRENVRQLTGVRLSGCEWPIIA